VLALARVVADFAWASDTERVLERVMSLALVQTGVGYALSVRGSSMAHLIEATPLSPNPPKG